MTLGDEGGGAWRNASRGAHARGGIDDGGSGGWDQFAANKSMFGVESTFDEGIYTTKLDSRKAGPLDTLFCRFACAPVAAALTVSCNSRAESRRKRPPASPGRLKAPRQRTTIWRRSAAR